MCYALAINDTVGLKRDGGPDGQLSCCKEVVAEMRDFSLNERRIFKYP